MYETMLQIKEVISNVYRKYFGIGNEFSNKKRNLIENKKENVSERLRAARALTQKRFFSPSLSFCKSNVLVEFFLKLTRFYWNFSKAIRAAA